MLADRQQGRGVAGLAMKRHVDIVRKQIAERRRLDHVGTLHAKMSPIGIFSPP
jgi:hypothetical protein